MAASHLPPAGQINGRVEVEVEVHTRTGRSLAQAGLRATLKALRMRIAGTDIDFTHTRALAGSRFVDLVLMTERGGHLR